jgi:Domain of unknown function (DUF5666)
MSGTDSMTGAPTPDGNGPVTETIVIKPDAGPVTEPVPVTRSSPGPTQFSTLPFDPTSEPDVWPAHAAAKGIRLRWPTAVLLVALIAGGGIWGGAALQRSHNNSSSSSLASALASRFSGRTGATGGSGGTGRSGSSRFAGFGGLGGAGAATTGTVTEVSGDTLYVTDASGGLVEVTLSSSTTVTRNAKSTLAALQPGDTVVVEGSKAKSGIVSATTVTATAEGVSSGFGGFGG